MLEVTQKFALGEVAMPPGSRCRCWVPRSRASPVPALTMLAHHERP